MKKSFYYVKVYNKEGGTFRIYPWVKSLNDVKSIRNEFRSWKVEQRKLT